jgi:Tfp pilus assembly protein PilF
MPQFLHAHALRFRARLAARRKEPDRADRNYRSAVGLFRELGLTFYLAVTLLEQGEWLAAHHRPDEAVAQLAEAREIFDRLQAVPWLDRLARTLPPAHQAGALGVPS